MSSGRCRNGIVRFSVVNKNLKTLNLLFVSTKRTMSGGVGPRVQPGRPLDGAAAPDVPFDLQNSRVTGGTWVRRQYQRQRAGNSVSMATGDCVVGTDVSHVEPR